MTTENQKFYGVSTPALMPDEMDTDMCAAPKRATTPAGAAYSPVLPPINKYASLENVLHRALQQAASGKGAERHATGLPFEDQPMQTISRLVGTHQGLIFQAIKKAQESTRLPTVERQVSELLGAVNYLAGAIIFLESPK